MMYTERKMKVTCHLPLYHQVFLILQLCAAVLRSSSTKWRNLNLKMLQKWKQQPEGKEATLTGKISDSVSNCILAWFNNFVVKFNLLNNGKILHQLYPINLVQNIRFVSWSYICNVHSTTCRILLQCWWWQQCKRCFAVANRPVPVSNAMQCTSHVLSLYLSNWYVLLWQPTTAQYVI